MEGSPFAVLRQVLKAESSGRTFWQDMVAGWSRDPSLHGCFLYLTKAGGPGGGLEHPYRLTLLLAALSLILTSACPGCLLPAHVSTMEVCDVEGLEKLHA